MVTLSAASFLISILLLCSHGIGQSPVENAHGHDPSLSHGYHTISDQIDPSMIIFTHIEDLKVGNQIRFYFRKSKQPPKFIPKTKADSIPFSSNHLPELLQFFSFPPGSPQAQAIKQTLDQCEFKPMKGEAKRCVTSLESLSDFIRGVLGLDTDQEFKVLYTTHLTESSTNPLFAQNYTLLGLREYLVPERAVGCHVVPYPYAVYHCHSLVGETKVFRVLLKGVEDGEMVEAPVICHIDTSQWGPDNVSFRVLGTQPGKSSPVCHIFAQYDFVSIPRV